MWIFNAIANAVGRNFIGTPNYLFGLLFNRVQADGGVTEAQQCTINELTELQNENLLSSASLVVTPSSYKESKLYSLIPTNGNGDFTFTRATTATRVNSSGLVELVPYNLLQRSEDFSNVVWLKEGQGSGNAPTFTANAGTAPNGTQTASRFQFSRSSLLLTSRSSARQSVTTQQANSVGSVWLKSFNGTTQFVSLVNTAANGGNIQVEVTNEWKRFETTFTGVVSGNQSLWIGLFDQISTVLSADVLVWGAQLVEGTNALPYQKTETRLNIPRLDYSSGACPSLLLEPQRTNLALRSQEFDNASWFKFGNASGLAPVVTSNAGTAPDGTLTADRLQFNCVGTTSSDRSILSQPSIPATIGSSYTMSFYVKAFAPSEVGKQLRIALEQGGISSVITLTADYQRIIFTGVASATTLNFLVETRGTFTTNTTADVLLWGAQVELGTYATSYIPTTSASVTRNGDEMVVSNLQSNSILSSTGLTYFMEFSKRNLPSADAYPRLENLTGNDIIGISTNSTELIASIRIGGGSFVNTPILSAYNNQLVKVAFSLNGTTLKIFVNGSLALTTTASASSIYERLDIKTTLDKDQRYKQIALWKTPLTDDQLEALTGEGFDTYAAMASYYNYTLQ